MQYSVIMNSITLSYLGSWLKLRVRNAKLCCLIYCVTKQPDLPNDKLSFHIHYIKIWNKSHYQPYEILVILWLQPHSLSYTVYPKKYAHGFCFAVLCCGYTLTDFTISIRLTSLALWQSNDCPSASKATLMNMDKYFMWIHCERLHNHTKAKHNKTVCIFLGIYCSWYTLCHFMT